MSEKLEKVYKEWKNKRVLVSGLAGYGELKGTIVGIGNREELLLVYLDDKNGKGASADRNVMTYGDITDEMSMQNASRFLFIPVRFITEIFDRDFIQF